MSKIRYTLGIAFIVIGSLHAIVLIWSGLDNVVAWKSLGTFTVLLCASLISVAIHSGSTPRLGQGTTPPRNPVDANDIPNGADGQNQVTYVFDRDLVRFLKFAGSVLAIFLVIGAFLYGIDLKKTLEVVQKTKEDTQKALGDVQTAQHDSKETELTIRSTKNDITQLVRDSGASAEEIKKARDSAQQTELATRKLSEQLKETDKSIRTNHEEIKKQVETARGLVTEIRGSRTKAQSLLAGIAKTPPESVRLSPDQMERLVEIKLLKSLRTILPGDQYAKLEKQFKSTADLRREIYDAKKQIDLPGKLVRSEGEPASEDTVATQVYNNIGTVHKFFQSNYGRNISGDVGATIRATVHYGQDFDNVFWNGNQLVIGDGDGVIFKSNSFGALSIVAAQLSYPVVQFSANFEHKDQPGALYTHFSDVFAALTEQWENKQTAEQASWLIGGGVLAPGINGVGLRSMKAPGTAYDDPKLGKDAQSDHMKNYVRTADDSGGVHINSGIPNRAFYEVAKAIGGNAWEKPGTIWYMSLLRMQATSSFEDCARTTYEVAGELCGKGSPEQEAVKRGWEKVGIVVGKGKSPN